MAVRWIVVSRWAEFQHPDMMRSGVPPWIKELTRQMSNESYLNLSFAQRGLLHGLRLEYARARWQLTDSTVSLTRRLGQRVFTRDLEALNHAGFIHFVASRPASPPASRPASLEKRRVETPLPPTGETFCELCQRDYRSVEDLDAHRFRIHSQDKPPIEEGS